MKKLIAISLIVLVAVAALYYYSSDEASATGGAFPFTKHGGGTTDGETPCAEGVNRGLGTDYSGDCVTASTTNAYHGANPEAGKYKSGECAHCHEPHAMFGTTEPAPSGAGDAGPDPYLVFKEYGTTANYSYLCWYCHQNISNINSSGSPATMGRWSFYQGQSVYTASSHYSSPSFDWPGTGGGAGEPWPRRDRSALPSGNSGSCLNCHTPHGIKAVDAANAYDITSPDGSGGVPAARQTVASGNPSVTSDYMIPRQLISWEENLCERCHDASGPSTKNIQTEINKRYPSPSASPASGHPIDDTAFAGRHVASEAIPITTKHVECYDCHNPHAVKAPTGVLGDGDGGRVQGMKFVDISGVVRDPATGFRQPYVYEICLKCHGNSFNTFIPDQAWPSGGHTLRTTVLRGGTFCATNINPASSCTDGSNKRLEFDTATNSADGFGGTLAGNRAYHPVAAVGRNTSVALTNSLLGGLTTASTINCTDCHNNETTGAGTFSGLTATPTYPGSVTESSLRVTDDTPPAISALTVGPHGSTNVRVLRANYNTTLGTTSAAPFASFDAANFALCFNCHNVAAFTDGDGLDGSGNRLTNFRQTGGMGCVSPKLNLHATHLTDVSGMGGWGFLGNMYTSCANCHYNVHSNAEATNTQYGTATGAGLPADGDTHLVNFSPLVAPYTYTKPRWWYTGSVMRCNLTCHGVTMEGGFGPSNADAWYTYYGS
mgnify:FL=1